MDNIWTKYVALNLILYIVQLSLQLLQSVFLKISSGFVPGNLPCSSNQSTDQRSVDSLRRIHSFCLVHTGLPYSLRDLGAIRRS